jgi:type IV secretory pathway TrbL component
MSTMKIAVGIFVITAAVHSCHAHAANTSAHAGNHAAGHLGSSAHSSASSQSDVSSTGQSAVGSNSGRVDVGNCDFAHWSICGKGN